MEPVQVHTWKGEFFKIIQETGNSQIGVMTIAPGKDSGPGDMHTGDQVVYILEGQARVDIKNETFSLEEGMAITIPARTSHRIYNTGASDLFTLNVYAPPAY